MFYAKIYLTAVLFCFTLGGCVYLDTKDHLVGNFFLVSADSDDDLALSFHKPEDGDIYLSVVSPSIVELAYDSNFILLKQNRYHPLPSKSRDIGEKLGTDSSFAYFIVRVNDTFDFRTNSCLIGPMSKANFNKTIIELKLENLTLHEVHK